ncbi:L-ascorbate oxidase [Actinidia chinensis var. chinensis]|uniref:L-ascorbate oxidase n=1 Tax=Actinidia chinensis var. chinensis TaxID=1590841 RepID=A0A2R6PZK1_ACTCC|nr:L-ascorbate oxidase [Actinidia chinensis var. chinensis]
MKPKIRLIASAIVVYVISVLLKVSVDAKSPQLFLDWTVSFSKRAPLGIAKQVIVINDQFPGPLLNATTNDVVNVNVHNNLTEPFLITWNGVQMRRNSWQDGVQGTNCPIMPGKNWTYSFQLKDQIGSFFYYPSLLLQKAAGGYGAIRVNSRNVIAIPFPMPRKEFDILIGDWYNVDHQELRARLDSGSWLPLPDGILINGLGPNQASFNFEPGATYRLRISNVGLKTTLNFRIQDHLMQLVETEGSYTAQRYYNSLDIHVGQSYSVLVTANNDSDSMSYYMVASARCIPRELSGVAIIRYSGFEGEPLSPLPQGPLLFDYIYSAEQALSIRWNLEASGPRPNPQGSYHYGSIDINRTVVLSNGVGLVNGKIRYTVNGVSFHYPDTPLKLADYFQLEDVFEPGIIPNMPDFRFPSLGTSVIDVLYRDYVQVVFHNPMPFLQTWHTDGYNFFVVGMGFGMWDVSKMATYNMVDAISRSTVQVYPFSWTAILIMLDNQGMWNLRSQDAERSYLGQELYIRVKGIGQDDPSTISPRDEDPIPQNALTCGRAIFA